MRALCTVRGAIVHFGAYSTQICERSSAWPRCSAEGALRVYAERQRVKCVATQASKKKNRVSVLRSSVGWIFLLIRCSGFCSVIVDLVIAADCIIYMYLMII